MKKYFLFLWLSLPVLWAYFHYGEGQRYVLQDHVAEIKKRADLLNEAGQWQESLKLYDEALLLLENQNLDRAESALRLAKSKVYLNNKQIVKATEEVESLMEMIYDKEIHLNKIDEDKVRASLGHSLYYMAWHMRGEGVAKQYWKKELESSRQHLRFLSEENLASSERLYNLQAAIALAKVDRKKLNLEALPKEDSGRGSQGVGAGRGAIGQQAGQGQESGEGLGEGEGQEDARGAGLGERPEGTGS
jgi:tetratricopeptide (TPR) repeat protein